MLRSLGLHLILLAFGISSVVHLLLLACIKIIWEVLFTIASARPGPNNAVDRIKPDSVNPRLGKRRVVVLNEIGVGLI